MKKLLFVIDNLDIGGPQKSLLALLDNIDYTSLDVSILSLHGEGTLSKYFNNNVHFLQPSEMLEAFVLPVSKPVWALLVFLKNGNTKLFFSALLSMIKFKITHCNMNQERQKIWQKYSRKIPIIEGNFDIAFGILGLSTYCIADLVNAKKKYHWVRSDPRFLQLNEEIEAAYFNRVDGALSVSKECANIYTRMYPRMAGKTYVFYNYIPLQLYSNFEIDTSLMDCEKRTTKLITVSRLAPHKGIENVLDVCNELVKRGLDIHWFVLGDGPDKDKYQQVAKEKGIQDKISFLGFQFNTIQFIRQADIFVHLSESEGKSNAVDEAKYIGIPIVITNYPTVKEQIKDGLTGIICPFDVQEIADSIEDIMKNEALAESLSSNCREESINSVDATEFILSL